MMSSSSVPSSPAATSCIDTTTTTTTNTPFTIEIVKDRLFFTIFEKKPLITKTITATTGTHVEVIHTDDLYDYLYVPFARDFGPPSVAKVYKFIKNINRMLNAQKKVIFYALSSDQHNTTNSVFLMGGYCIFGDLSWSASKTEERFSALHRFMEPYRDASESPMYYGLSMESCFRAMEKAKKLSWIDMETFNYKEYTFYEQVENGDFNWILPNKFIAMCSPTDVAKRTATTITHTPQYYISYFKEHSVSTIIRLNSVEYNRETFINAGVDHHDLYFADGTTPPISIVERFLQIVEAATGVVAVHCKQGLGRTGTLIACYLMKHYDLTAAECIAYLRIQRPGSVVGPQQNFLHKMEPIMALGRNKDCCSPKTSTPSSSTLSKLLPTKKNILSPIEHIRSFTKATP